MHIYPYINWHLHYWLWICQSAAPGAVHKTGAEIQFKDTVELHTAIRASLTKQMIRARLGWPKKHILCVLI